jgi:hypothetical protein
MCMCFFSFLFFFNVDMLYVFLSFIFSFLTRPGIAFVIFEEAVIAEQVAIKYHENSKYGVFGHIKKQPKDLFDFVVMNFFFFRYLCNSISFIYFYFFFLYLLLFFFWYLFIYLFSMIECFLRNIQSVLCNRWSLLTWNSNTLGYDVLLCIISCRYILLSASSVYICGCILWWFYFYFIFFSSGIQKKIFFFVICW